MGNRALLSSSDSCSCTCICSLSFLHALSSSSFRPHFFPPPPPPPPFLLPLSLTPPLFPPPPPLSLSPPNKQTWQRQLASALYDHEPTSFAVQGELAEFSEVSVDGVGALAMPVGADAFAALLALSEPAPHGQGMATVVDEAVRRARQVAGARVHLTASQAVQDLARSAAQQLGVTVPVEAQLDKLVLYEAGGHFRPHVDSEKAPGMFATLVVQLPVEGGHRDGQLLVSHFGQRDVVVKFAEHSHGVYYAAFFADCRHELRPITHGRRIALLFNLVRVSGGELPNAGDPSTDLTRAVAAWVRAVNDADAADAADVWDHDEEPKTLRAVRLTHDYTRANSGFSFLKGDDMVLASKLRSCPALDVVMVLMIRTVRGPSNGETADEDRMEIDEQYSYEDTNTWGFVPGVHANISGLELTEHDLLDDVDPVFEYWPDERTVHPTGNEGPTLEYVYHSAFLVFWPRQLVRRALSRAGDHFALASSLLTARLAHGWTESVADLLDCTLRTYWYGSDTNSLLRVLGAINQVPDNQRAAGYALFFIRRLRATDVKTEELAGALGALVMALGDDQVADAACVLLEGAWPERKLYFARQCARYPKCQALAASIIEHMLPRVATCQLPLCVVITATACQLLDEGAMALCVQRALTRLDCPVLLPNLCCLPEIQAQAARFSAPCVQLVRAYIALNIRTSLLPKLQALIDVRARALTLVLAGRRRGLRLPPEILSLVLSEFIE